MKFRSTFLGRQYAGLFTAATLMAGADFCIGLVVSVVSGNCLGADAFAAMAAVYPYRLLPDIFALLLADGTCSLYAQAIGRCDREDAARIFSRGLLAAVVVGVALTVAFVFGENAYLDFMGVAPAVRREALAFGSGFVYTFLPTLVIMYLYPLVYIDGGAKRCLYGSIGYMVIQIATAWLFCRWWGAAGLAWSVFAALLAFAASIACHLFSPECSFRYRPTFDLGPLGKVFALGFGTSVQQIAAVVQTFVLVRIASRNFGEAGLSCLAVVAAVESFLCFTKAASQSALPLVSVYYGEGNRSGIVWTMRLGLACVLVEGLLFMGLLLAVPHAVAVLFGLGSTEYAGLLAQASRIVGFFILPASLTFFWGMYFRMVGNTRILAVYAPMQWIVFPLAFSVAGAYVFGPVGFACGFAGQLAWLLIAATWGYVSAWRKNLDFPLMLPREAAGTTTRISVRADAAGAAEAARCVRAIIGEKVKELGGRWKVGGGTKESFISTVQPSTFNLQPYAMALVAEEVVLVIAEANVGRKVHVEMTIDLSNPEKPRLIVRDDGRIFDLTDPDQNMRSMSAYVLSRVVSVKAERINLTTAGHNRSILAFS